mmetsp:Transcript_37800/g.112845  ORF Transcript_37800/g.112845 Transcript_37800/m.112845 type:complete len:262 (-) Transcript_37800:834-1619(-)
MLYTTALSTTSAAVARSTAAEGDSWGSSLRCVGGRCQMGTQACLSLCRATARPSVPMLTSPWAAAAAMESRPASLSTSVDPRVSEVLSAACTAAATLLLGTVRETFTAIELPSSPEESWTSTSTLSGLISLLASLATTAAITAWSSSSSAESASTRPPSTPGRPKLTETRSPPMHRGENPRFIALFVSSSACCSSLDRSSAFLKAFLCSRSWWSRKRSSMRFASTGPGRVPTTASLCFLASASWWACRLRFSASRCAAAWL